MRAPSEVRAIQVDYEYLGWGHEEQRFTLTPSANDLDYDVWVLGEGAARPHDTGHKVTWEAVDTLLVAASAPAWTREQGVRAVALPLRRAAVSDIEAISYMPPLACTTQELKRLARLRVNQQGLPALVDEHYGTGLSWTDDYPRVTVQILFRKKPPLRFYSDSQKTMMLPWSRGDRVDSEVKSDENWSVALSQALREVLPKDSSMHERLGSDRLLWHLRTYLQHHIVEDCNAIRGKVAAFDK